MSQDMDDLKEQALSDADLRKAFAKVGDTAPPIHPQTDLQKVSSLDDLLDNKGRMILLYLTEDEQTGHWVGLEKRPSGWRFFDPQGNAPDKQLDWIGRDKAASLGMVDDRLVKMMRQSGLPIFQSKDKFQQEKYGTNTCGRHVMSRLMFADLTPKEQRDMIGGSGMSADDFVSGLSVSLLDK